MYQFICVNAECPEVGIIKTRFDLPPDGVNVLCGHCGEPCTTDGIDYPYTPPPTMDERVTALEQFNEELVSALMAVFDPANAATASSLSDLLPKKEPAAAPPPRAKK